ncbi:MAG: hypothetical protein A3D24_02740 [Candidatus Blackburnbacteria bacterium RIFCSPHIGHO2_02_FULL_39_13]|uniref:Uncharacterized protein n=1 Tax=Candidatus Blackburnbacteria bacterium RIFCSPLOWO2_01_FULL_40_20 TaxID=1797519 RepID=A0A1G1VBV0_9BACT|nr:MAG: hypothetical protein A2694_01645 [Candidatus Blackburnbacteria bacterium RIFCSPHIGHO2_01_FULL_40_17]OGY07742.1 MAG: hypothetical protein A3D24_02740 [Candidatus Blackburnbacteria bacterium RIFCSPHIGHO2_02_FULL_39_13]OGY12801.1 MAG: hypothetical protein A3A77_02905 [Candidatus Blackburnbacteria bacterium RIFCSPLOWO2_01_FULL_40_20]
MCFVAKLVGVVLTIALVLTLAVSLLAQQGRVLWEIVPVVLVGEAAILTIVWFVYTVDPTDDMDEGHIGVLNGYTKGTGKS